MEEDNHYPGADINAPDDLDFNEAIGEPQRNCDQCGKLDDCSFCRNDMQGDDPGEHLCFDCANENGFCFGCGQFCAGMESFDFSPITGYCANCVDQIRSTVADDYGDDFDDDWNDEEFDRCSDCDGHDACADFGCAIQMGLGHMVRRDDIL